MTTDPLGRPLVEGARCQYCGSTHSTVCSRIARIEYDEEGTVMAICMHEPLPFSVDKDDGDESESVCGSYEDVKRWQREKLQ